MSKKTIFYYCLLAEEAIAYYLTFKWPLIFFACIISLFPTVMVFWSLKLFFNVIISWGLIFFLIWLIIMVIFFLEFPLPKTLKENVKNKFKEVE